MKTAPDTTSSSCPSSTVRSPMGFAIDVLKLASGTTISQVLVVLVSPILARLYAPEAFGILAVFTSIINVLGVIACLRYELAIMLPQSENEAANLLGASLVFAVLTSLLTVPVIWWGQGILLRWLNTPELASHTWLIPLTMLLTSIFTAFNYWNSRTKHFGRLSLARVTKSVTTTVANLGLGFAGAATGGTLLGASVGGQALATTILGIQIWRDDGKLFVQSINWQGVIYGIKRHHKFPLISMWSALLNSIAWQLPTFLLSALFSSTVVGYYALGFRLLRMPMILVGGAIAQVFYQRAAEARTQGGLADLVEKVLELLVRIGLFPILTLTVVGRDLFIVVFGAEWAEAGTYVQIMSIWLFLQFISSPITTLGTVLEKQEIGFFRNVFFLLATIGAFWIGGKVGNARLALALLSVFGFVIYGSLCLILAKMSGVAYSDVLRSIYSNAAKWLPAGFLLILLTLWGTSSLQKVAVAGALIAVYYAYLSFILKDQLRSAFSRSIAGKSRHIGRFGL